MARKARSISLGNSKFSSRTSISKTSAPRERNALATPRAVASETSRSEPGPPINTAIFFGSAFISFTLPPLRFALRSVIRHHVFPEPSLEFSRSTPAFPLPSPRGRSQQNFHAPPRPALFRWRNFSGQAHPLISPRGYCPDF